MNLEDKLKYGQKLSYSDMKRIFYNELLAERREYDEGYISSIFEIEGRYYKMIWLDGDDPKYGQPYEVELIPASVSTLRSWVEK